MILQHRTALLVILAIAVTLSVTPAEANQCKITVTPANNCKSCIIDLISGTTNCGPDLAPWISFGPGPFQAVMQIAPLDGSGFPPWIRAIFDIYYMNIPGPGEWTVNIGDSQSNNGFGGDGSDQSRDSELQIVAQDLTVWADDHLNAGATCPTCCPAPATKETLELCDLIDDPFKNLKLEITDNQLRWNGEPGACERDGTLRSQFIYSLGGQPDFEGPVNGDIFAAFNRTVQFHPSRVGQSVARVELILCDS